MAWVDPKTGRRYNDKEVAAMEQQGGSGSVPFQDPQFAMGRSLSPENLSNMATGAKNALKKTWLGVKQLGAYGFGSDDDRERVNQEIAALERETEDAGAAGTVGEFVGNAAQFMIPGSMVAKATKILPAAKAVTKVTGQGGSVRRGALDAAAFEAAQPVNPGDLSNEDFALGKLGNVAQGVATAVPTAAGAKVVTKPWLQVDPERAALAKEAERLGLKLTPAQRTGDRTLQQYEEGLLAKPGSGKLIAEARSKQQQVLNKKAAEALGLPHDTPNEAALAIAGERAAKGYKPIAKIPVMKGDAQLQTTLEGIIANQESTVAGSPDVKRAAQILAESFVSPNNVMTGQRFLQELQSVRNLAFKARRDGLIDTANQFHALSDAMEDFAERKVAELAGSGAIDPQAVASLRKARTDYAKIRAIEKAVDPVTGTVSANKFLNQEFKRRPAHKGQGSSGLETGLRDVGATARILRQTQPYIGSSGTAERMAGQQMVEMTTGPWTAIKGGVPLMKNYLAAKYYLAHGGEPGYLARHLSPEANMMVRRLIPQEAVAAGEAID